MSTFKHNKKKNLFLIWEFFSYHMAQMILENKDIEGSRQILVKYMINNKDLQKEFETVKALMELRNIQSTAVATNAMRSLEKHVKEINLNNCETSKNKLIAEVARLKDNKFFDRKVNADFYRDAALAHTLVSYWAGRPGVSILEATRIEDYFVSLLTEQKAAKETNDNVLELQKEDIDNLVVHVMSKKFNDLYGKELNEIQIAILKEWVIVQSDEVACETTFKQKLQAIKEEIVKYLVEQRKIALETNKEGFATVISESITKIAEYKENKVNDDYVAFHLGMIGLIDEFKNAANFKEQV